MSRDSKNLFLGIDVGTDSVKMVLLRKDKSGRVYLSKAVKESYENNSQATTEEHSSDLEYLLKKFLRREKNLSRSNIGICISGRSAFVRWVKVPVTAPEKLRQIVLYETQQQIPFPIKDVVWDFQIYGRDKKQLSILLAAVKKELIVAVFSAFEACSLEVEFVDVSNLALYNCLQYFFRDLKNTLVLDCGAKTTNIIVVNFGKIWTRSLPIGGENITEAIAQSLKIKKNEAEQVKKEKGQVLMLYYGKQLSINTQEQKIAEAITEVLTDLNNEVVKTLNFYKSQHTLTMNFHKVLLTGGVSKTENIDKFFENSLAIQTEKLDFFSFLNFDSKLDKQMSEFLGPAIGLALRGHGRSVLNINLLPQEELKIKAFKKKTPFIIGLCVLVVLILLSMNIFLFKKHSLYNSYVDKLNQILLENTQNEKILEQLKTEISSYRSSVSKVEQTLSGKYLDIFMLKNIAESMPKSIWLKKLNFDFDARKLSLEGCCKGNINDIAKFSQNLKKNKLVKSLKIETVGKDKNNFTFSFTVLLNLNAKN